MTDKQKIKVLIRALKDIRDELDGIDSEDRTTAEENILCHIENAITETK